MRVSDSNKEILRELDKRFPMVERKEGGVTAKEYAKKGKVSVVTARNRLNLLVEKEVMYLLDCTMDKGVTGVGNKVYYLK